MKINQIWDQLETDKSSTAGLIYKRYSADIISNIFVALRVPERLRCIAIHIRSDFDINVHTWEKLRDIKVEAYPDVSKPDKQFLLLLLLNKEYSDIFAALCEDLMVEAKLHNKAQQFRNQAGEEELTKKLLSRLSKWQSLFEKSSQQGLSSEAQRGLYGELFLLRRLLENSFNHDSFLNSWVGPEKAVQDFQHGDWALEVKTTHGKNHQKIHITSERQLDTSVIPNIYLYHLSIDVRESHGEALNEAVDQIKEILQGNYYAINVFSLKLLNYGYFPGHRHLYEEVGYSIRQEKCYAVTDDFPRITEAQVPGGVGDVRYSIVLSDNVPWEISFEGLIEKITTR